MIAIAPKQKPITLTEALQIADIKLPESTTTFMSFEGDRQRKVIVHKKYPQDIFPTGLSSVAIDRDTGNVISVQKVIKPTVGHRIARSIKNIHSGAFAGIVSKILYVFVGLSPVILFFTGLTIFKQRRWLKARRKETVRQSKSTVF